MEDNIINIQLYDQFIIQLIFVRMQNKKRQQQRKRKQKEEDQFKIRQNKIKEILNQNGITYNELYKKEVVEELQYCWKDLKQIPYIVDANIIEQKVNAITYKQIYNIVGKICSGGNQFIDAVKKLQKLPNKQNWLGDIIGRILEKYLQCDIAYQKVINILDVETNNKEKYQQLTQELNMIKQFLKDRNGTMKQFSQTGKDAGLQQILQFIKDKSQSNIQINSNTSTNQKIIADKVDKEVCTQPQQKYPQNTNGSRVIKQKIRQEDRKKIKDEFDNLRKKIKQQKQEIQEIIKFMRQNQLKIINDLQSNYKQKIDIIVLQYQKKIAHLEDDLKKQKSITNQNYQGQLKKKLSQQIEKKAKQKVQKLRHQKKILSWQNNIKPKEVKIQKVKTQNKQSMTQKMTQKMTQDTNQYINKGFSSEILLGRQLAFWSPLLLGYELSKYEKPKIVHTQQRDYLLKTLQEYTKKKVKRTKLLYSYDNIVQTNFHLYVDNIPNYVVILKLKNGNLIGAYSENALVSMVGNKGPGFIASLTNKIPTYIDSKIQGARTTNYNQYYMIFGNDEFRFQPQKREVTCLVGYQFSFYRPKISPKDLLGVQSETSEFVNYEVHKVIFDNDEQ